MSEPLHVPELRAGADTLTAALQYAAAGFYVGPAARATKHPGSRLGAGWQDRTSRDPEVIVSWFAGTDDGVFLHCGRSGAVVLDVDHPDLLPAVLADALRDHPTPMQTTRTGDADRGHYLYAMPPGRLLGNGTGKLGGAWGDVRGSNGVIFVAPSVHRDAANGGLYAWQRTGVLAPLPESIAVLLGDAEASTAPATPERLRIFADTYTADLDRRPLAAWCNRFEKLTAGGASRHETMKDLLPGAFEEVLAGLYPARLACERLTAVFTAATVKPSAGAHQGAARTEREAVAEWLSMARWALARAETSDPATVLVRVGKVFPDLAAPSAPGDAEDSGPAATATTASKASVSTQLVELAAASYRFGQSSKHEPFAVPLGGSNVARMLRGAGGSLRAELAAAYFAEHRKIAPQQALTDAVLTLEGMAQQAEPEALHLRSAVAGEGVWLDLGGTTGAAVQITGHGWRVRESAPVLFHRTALTAALPEPEPGGSLAELWAMLNVAPEDHPLVLAWLLAALLTPDLPCPVLALTGEQGTGKTTATKRAAALVDPTHPQVRRSPKDGEAWVSAATGSRVVALDNVSAIPEWFSDALCRAVTGDGDVRRRLYSDGDYHVIAFRRAVVVNGIDLGAVRDDLAERLLTVQLDRITEDLRGRESDLEQRWQHAHPRLLGAVLDLAVQVLAAREASCPARLPRMADFAHTLATVDHVLGTDGLDRYRAQAQDMAADTVGSDPVLRAIAARITEPWEGTGAELLDTITSHDEKPPKGWPGTARAMTGELRCKAPVLRRLGWTVDDLGRRGKASAVRFALVPSQASNRQATQATGKRQDALASDSEPHRLPNPPPLTSADAENRAKASDASDETPYPLCCDSKKVEERAPDDNIRVRSDTSLASLASLADPLDAAIDVATRLLGARPVGAR